MDDAIYQRLANSLLSLVTDFPMDAGEIKEAIKTQGLDRFINNLGGQAFEIFEIAELLLMVGKRG